MALDFQNYLEIAYLVIAQDDFLVDSKYDILAPVGIKNKAWFKPFRRLIILIGYTEQPLDLTFHQLLLVRNKRLNFNNEALLEIILHLWFSLLQKSFEVV